jgi:putative ABC transport system permease protein
VLSLIVIAAKQLWHHKLLMLCLLIGLIVAVGLLSSIPLYADAVHNKLLQGELTETGVHRPPFAFMWRYVGAWNGEIAWEQYQPVDEYLSQQAGEILGLPIDDQVRHISTAKLRLFPSQDGAFFDDTPLLWASTGFIDGLEELIRLVEGDLPGPNAAGEPVDVLISQPTAEALGFQIGETYLLLGAGGDDIQIPVRISGVWSPEDPSSPMWFYQPDAFDEMLLTNEEAFRGQIVPLLEEPVSNAVWYQIYDGRRVRPAATEGLLNGVARVEARVTALLDGATLDSSPVNALQDYGQAARQSSLTLTIFSLPLIGITLYFIALIAGLVVRRGQSEIAVMRSRGTTRGQIVLIYLLQGLLIGGLGLVGGLLFGKWLAQLMGRTRTFLDSALLIGDGETLVTVLSTNAISFALIGIGLALVALLIPALRTSKHTIVSLRWTQARELERPIWQRYFLDLFLLALPLYGWYQLNRQGTLVLLGRSDDPFANPMLFLVPVLFAFGLALFLMRLFPLVMGGLARLATLLPSTTLLLTLRQLSRSAGVYAGPLLLLCLTVSLATFTASLALTLDNHLRDQIYYRVGADLNLAELGENTEATEQASFTGQEQILAETAGNDEEGARWLFLPVTEHLQVPGVLSAARVGDFSATANIGGRQQSGSLLGIDRVDFPHVAFFRPDFAANEPLGGLMNRLAVDQANILASRDFLTRNNLRVGEPLRLTVGTAGEVADVEFLIAGPLDLFPTRYPQDGPFFIASLEYIHEQMGGAFPYAVWLNTDPSVDSSAIVDGVRDLGLVVVNARDARANIATEQLRPARQGLFGLLSVGFLAAAVLTVLGFLVYAVMSFQRRFIELGMLRAIGLSVGQMSLYLAGEQAALIVTGVGLGTALGLLTSRIFIPYFQVGGDKFSFVPPFVTQIAWVQLGTIYWIFALMYLCAVGVLLVLLARMKIFEAIKLGEAV